MDSKIRKLKMDEAFKTMTTSALLPWLDSTLHQTTLAFVILDSPRPPSTKNLFL